VSDKYYLKADWQSEYQEVTKEQFIDAEQSAGFHSKFGPNEIATGGFSGRGISGKVEYVPSPPPSAPRDPK
jgi:hypothetical protein